MYKASYLFPVARFDAYNSYVDIFYDFYKYI